MSRAIKEGSVIMLNSDAKENENYEGYYDREIVVENVYNSSEENQFYDEGLSSQALVEGYMKDNGENFPFAVYEWEFDVISY